MMRSVWAMLGRRGVFLLFLALLDFLYGWSILNSPAIASKLHLLVPYQAWGWGWTVTGALLAAGAFLKRDRLFFGWSAFMKAAFAGAWVDVWMNDPQVPRAWISAVIWGAFAALVLVVSGWPEVHPLGTERRPPVG